MTYWLDVEDFFRYAADGNKRPSGIQRVCFEVWAALAQRVEVRFCRHSSKAYELVEVSWAEIEAVFEALCAGSGSALEVQSKDSAARAFAVPKTIRRCLDRLPQEARSYLGTATRAQVTALSAATCFVPALWRGLRRRTTVQQCHRTTVPQCPHATLQPGDVLLALGAPWTRSDYGTMLSSLKLRYKMKFGILLYDLIPIVRPEFCHPSLIEIFTTWCRSTLPHCDVIMTISHATAVDVRRVGGSIGIRPNVSILPIPIGTGFAVTKADALTAPLPSAVVAQSRYALFVSTIEPRKNHVLAFRIWRRLLEQMPRDQVPILVFAGRLGWMSENLIQQIANTRWLDGHLIHVRETCDAVLQALYRGSAFTLFPSLYEGWGLPVSESLGFGRPCLASTRTSIPEAGGNLCAYFDPEDGPAAYALVHRIITDRALLGEMEARIAQVYRPTPWSVTAATILEVAQEALLHVPPKSA
ncbi:glycosyltransferase family 4 protein [Candidatus Darwinibacter acetoxidans]